MGMRGAVMVKRIVATSLGAVIVACTAAHAATPTPKPKPSKSSKYTAAIAAASDDLVMVNGKVRAAAAKLSAAQSKLPAARRAYASAMSALGAAQRADAKATAALQSAIARAQASAAALARSDSAVQMSESEFGHLVRQLYMSGGTMLQAQVVLESRNPVDLGTRIVGIDRVGRMSNRRLATLRSIRTANAKQAAQAKADKEQVAVKRAAVHAQLAVTKSRSQSHVGQAES